MRIGVLESVVQGHSSRIDQLNTRVDHLTTNVDQLTIEVRDLRRRFDRREDLDALERRVTEIEQQLARRPE